MDIPLVPLLRNDQSGVPSSPVSAHEGTDQRKVHDKMYMRALAKVHASTVDRRSDPRPLTGTP